MAWPVPPARQTLFDTSYVRFHDAPASVSIDETDPGGAATVPFTVQAPSIVIRGKSGTSLYWLRKKTCADGAIVLSCPDGLHVHLVELKKTIGAGKWADVKAQFNGMLANVQAVLGTASLPPPASVSCHVAFATDQFVTALVLSKVVNTVTGPSAFAGADWASGTVDLLDWPGTPLNKITWGSPPVALVCP